MNNYPCPTCGGDTNELGREPERVGRIVLVRMKCLSCGKSFKVATHTRVGRCLNRG